MNLRSPLATLALAALAPCAPALGAATYTDTFEGGANNGGWTISGGGVIETTGGNPDSWLHIAGLNTFAPVIRTTDGIHSRFVGDYREMSVTRISVDAQLLFRDWGDPVGFEMSLLLRDTKGTPAPDDDDYAYYVGPNVPLMGEGWVHYDFDVPSASTDAVPAGWSGGWAGDLENFRPGVDWNDVITNVDRVEIWWLHPALAAIFSTWDVGADNIGITTDPPCPEDINGDGTINVLDLVDLLLCFGLPAAPGCEAEDVNGDGNVNVLDLVELLLAFGTSCP